MSIQRNYIFVRSSDLDDESQSATALSTKLSIGEIISRLKAVEKIGVPKNLNEVIKEAVAEVEYPSTEITHVKPPVFCGVGFTPTLNYLERILLSDVSKSASITPVEKTPLGQDAQTPYCKGNEDTCNRKVFKDTEYCYICTRPKK